MSTRFESTSESTKAEGAVDVARIENFDGIGDITIGVGSNWHIIAVALCLFNNPEINKFFLLQRLKLVDRLTKTKIFPRVGMALPSGEVYQEPQVEELELPNNGD